MRWLSCHPIDQIIYLVSIPYLAMFTLVKEYTNYLLSACFIEHWDNLAHTQKYFLGMVTNTFCWYNWFSGDNADCNISDVAIMFYRFTCTCGHYPGPDHTAVTALYCCYYCWWCWWVRSMLERSEGGFPDCQQLPSCEEDSCHDFHHSSSSSSPFASSWSPSSSSWSSFALSFPLSRKWPNWRISQPILGLQCNEMFALVPCISASWCIFVDPS